MIKSPVHHCCHCQSAKESPTAPTPTAIKNMNKESPTAPTPTAIKNMNNGSACYHMTAVMIA